MRKVYTTLLSLIVFVGCTTTPKATTVEINPETPDQAIECLIEGNHRFMIDSCINPHHDTERMKETALHQNPYVAIVGCSDSRVPQEVIFDQGIGDIFAIRVAGNNVNDNHVMGSIEYAANHLGVKVIMILGHSHCGGLTAAITPAPESDSTHHSTSEVHLDTLLNTIKQDIQEFVGNPTMLDAAIKSHTAIQVQKVISQPEINKLIEKGKIKVVGAIYDIETGKVTLL